MMYTVYMFQYLAFNQMPCIIYSFHTISCQSNLNQPIDKVHPRKDIFERFQTTSKNKTLTPNKITTSIEPLTQQNMQTLTKNHF